MAILITQAGEVRYARKEKGVSKTMKGPLQRFDGDNFVVGIGPVSSTFAVGVAPHRDGDVWKMTVDGVEAASADMLLAPDLPHTTAARGVEK